MIKVAFNYSESGGHAKRGVGSYAEGLIEELKKIKELDLDVSELQNKDLSKYDLIHYPFFHPYFLSFPLIKKNKTIVTIHDVTPLLFSKNYPAGIKGKIIFFIQKILLNQIDGFITVSESAKKDIVRKLGISEGKVKVIYNGINKEIHQIKNAEIIKTVKEKYQLPEKFVLYVGDVNYNKNLLSLANACVENNLSLVIVGKSAARDEVEDNTELKPFKEFLKQFKDNPLIKRIGYVPDEELSTIYSTATLYCQPSFYEGFSLPILEAFSCGCPVVASDISTHREIVGDAALFAEPNSKDLGEKISKLFKEQNLREELIAKGFERVKDFSWKKAAEETFEFYNKIIKQ